MNQLMQRPKYARRSIAEFAAIGITDYAILALISGGCVVFYTERLSYTWAENKPQSPLHLKRFDDYQSAFDAIVSHKAV